MVYFEHSYTPAPSITTSLTITKPNFEVFFLPASSLVCVAWLADLGSGACQTQVLRCKEEKQLDFNQSILKRVCFIRVICFGGTGGSIPRFK